MQRHPIYTPFHWPESFFNLWQCMKKGFYYVIYPWIRTCITTNSTSTKTRVWYEVMYVFVVFSFATYFAFVKVLAGICSSSEHILWFVSVIEISIIMNYFFPSFFKIKETKRKFILMMFDCLPPCCYVFNVALVTESCGGGGGGGRHYRQHGNVVCWLSGMQ